MFSEKIENVSNFVGKKTLAPILGYLRTDYVEKFNVKTYGIENLKEIIDKPHIIFSNHNSLVEGGDDSGTRPDHLFIFNQIYKTTGEKITIVGQIDYEKNPKNKILNDVQEKIILPIKEGFNKSIGDDLIPVRNNPKKLNRNFISDVNEILDLNKRSILIFPQVVGDIDYNPELPFQSGIFHIYKTRLKQELSSVPLIPVYVHGCDSWKPYKNQQIEICFGESFYFPKNVTKNEVEVIMRDKILKLKESTTK